MKKNSIFLFSMFWLIVVICISSCYQKCGEEVDSAYLLLYSNPDSAIAILTKCDKELLSPSERAKYSLCYYMAQDKSGIDVASDSILRVAYDYYSRLPQDSLFGKCKYYMGKYYMLVDSVAKAKLCFEQSIASSAECNDTNTMCLATEKLSKVIRAQYPSKALKYAQKAHDIYNEMSYCSTYNSIYYKLNLGECYYYMDSISKAIAICKDALMLTNCINNNNVYSDVCQNISVMYSTSNMNDSALYYAKLAYKSTITPTYNKMLALASAFINSDSLLNAKECLSAIPLNDINASLKSSVFYCYQYIAIKEQDFNGILKYSDSIYVCTDKILLESERTKDEYYTTIIAKETERAKLHSKASLRMAIMCFIIALLVVFIFFVIHVYKYRVVIANRKQQEAIREANLLLKYEREMKLKEMEMQAEIHAEQIENKEKQMAIMRQYLLHKIGIAEKIDNFKSENKRILLSEEDWEEAKMFLDSIEGMFVSRLMEQFPKLSEKDIRLMMLLKLDIPTKQLALIYSISEKSVKQKLFVCKEKVGIMGEKVSLRDFIKAY